MSEEIMTEYSRIIHDPDTNQNLDEHLEVVFHEIFNEHVSNEEAIGALLDPYATEVNGTNAVKFGNALKDAEQAIRWASQYGSVKIDPASAYQHLAPVPGYEKREIQWVVSVGECKQDATARLLPHAIVLAGVQWLRVVADSVLNSGRDGATQH